jgi:hypothetical protein
MENTQRVQPTKATLRNHKSVLEMEVWKRLGDEDLWLGPKGVIVNSQGLEERKFFYNIVQVS